MGTAAPTNGKSKPQVAEVIDCFRGIDFNGMVTDELFAAAKKYLEELHISGWGQHFSIHDEKGRQRAAEWLVPALIGVLEALIEEV